MTDSLVKDLDTFPFAADLFEQSVKPTPSHIQIVQPAGVIVYELLISQGQLLFVRPAARHALFLFIEQKTIFRVIQSGPNNKEISLFVEEHSKDQF